jgi:hypothetical protein
MLSAYGQRFKRAVAPHKIPGHTLCLEHGKLYATPKICPKRSVDEPYQEDYNEDDDRVFQLATMDPSSVMQSLKMAGYEVSWVPYIHERYPAFLRVFPQITPSRAGLVREDRCSPV